MLKLQNTTDSLTQLPYLLAVSFCLIHPKNEGLKTELKSEENAKKFIKEVGIQKEQSSSKLQSQQDAQSGCGKG